MKTYRHLCSPYCQEQWAENQEVRVLIPDLSLAHCDILGKSLPPPGPLFPDPCTMVNGMDDCQPKQLWGVDVGNVMS